MERNIYDKSFGLFIYIKISLCNCKFDCDRLLAKYLTLVCWLSIWTVYCIYRFTVTIRIRSLHSALVLTQYKRTYYIIYATAFNTARLIVLLHKWSVGEALVLICVFCGPWLTLILIRSFHKATQRDINSTIIDDDDWSVNSVDVWCHTLLNMGS